MNSVNEKNPKLSSVASVADTVLQTRLQTLFQLNPYLALYHLDIEVARGQVLLNGTVTHDAISQLAESICRSVCEGKYQMQNLIEVDHYCAGDISNGRMLNRVRDLNTATGIRIKYGLNRFISGTDIQVYVDHSRVVLSGSAESTEAINQAVQIARDTYGVVSVVNNIRREGAEGTEGRQSSSAVLSGLRKRATDEATASRVPENVKIMLSLSMRLSGQHLKVVDYEKEAGLLSMSGETADRGTKRFMEKMLRSVCGVDQVDTDKVQVRSQSA